MSVEVLNVDLDDCGEGRARCILRAAGVLGRTRLYRTRGGYHITVKLDIPMDISRSLYYRRFLCDDTARVDLDMASLEAGDLRAFDRLFEGRVKGGHAFERVLVDGI